VKVRRPGTSLFLILCGVTLLVSIFAGEKMGTRVLQRTTQTTAVVPDVTTPEPSPSAVLSGPIVDWHRLQVVTVATDPGFPDPRVTKPPTPTPKPTPSPRPSPPSQPSFGPGASPGATAAPANTLPSYAIPTPFVPPTPLTGGG